MDIWKEVAKSGTLVLASFLILWLSFKGKWKWTHDADHQSEIERTSFQAIIGEKDKTIAEKDKAMEIVRTQYEARLAEMAKVFEARLAEKDEECDRERTRLMKSEAFTDRLVGMSLDATSLAVRASQTVKEARE